MTPQGRPPSARPVFFAEGPFDAERIARLYWMLTGQETSPEELEELKARDGRAGGGGPAMKIRPHDTQWAAQWAVGYELARRGHGVSFTYGNEPAVDARVTSPGQFSYCVQVKGQQGKTSTGRSDWYIKCPTPKDDATLFFFVAVPTDQEKAACAPRIAIMTAAEVRAVIHTPNGQTPYIRWRDTVPHLEQWGKLPA
jgi:hypothetical protein